MKACLKGGFLDQSLSAGASLGSKHPPLTHLRPRLSRPRLARPHAHLSWHATCTYTCLRRSLRAGRQGDLYLLPAECTAPGPGPLQGKCPATVILRNTRSRASSCDYLKTGPFAFQPRTRVCLSQKHLGGWEQRQAGPSYSGSPQGVRGGEAGRTLVQMEPSELKGPLIWLEIGRRVWSVHRAKGTGAEAEAGDGTGTKTRLQSLSLGPCTLSSSECGPRKLGPEGAGRESVRRPQLTPPEPEPGFPPGPLRLPASAPVPAGG